MRKLIFVLSFLLVFFSVSLSLASQNNQRRLPKLLIFHSPSCHQCLEAKKKIIPEIEQEFSGKILIEYWDVTDIENYKMLLSLREKAGQDAKISLPVFYFEGHFLDNQTPIVDTLKKLIADSRGRKHHINNLPKTDLIAHFKNFKPLAIISAGLIDGINPCAFTVMVFFISYLALQGYIKGELIVIGLTFIFAVFTSYVLIGLGLFTFLYRLKGFWLVMKIFNLSVGILSITLGVFALYDFFKFKKTKSTDGLLLQLPAVLKHRIHSVIGTHYRDTKTKGGSVTKKNTLRLVYTCFATGFLVSILEAVCTGQVYLPTIAFVLKTSHLKLEALGYLLLYNIVFVVPLLIIFLFALLGITSEQFSLFLKRHLALVKTLMAILFFALGIYLIWRV
jgi:cytochrome c biogenesis protein CcdA